MAGMLSFSHSRPALPGQGGSLLPHLNGFLHSAVGTERNGMELSVLSLLARSGKDPWAEAARLARMPSATAAESLADVIAGVPGDDWSRAEALVIAQHLVTLLVPQVASRVAVPVGVRAWDREMVKLMLGSLLGAALALTILLLNPPSSWLLSGGGSVQVPAAARPRDTR